MSHEVNSPQEVHPARPSRDLLTIRFISPKAQWVRKLSEQTGMIIGDVNNPQHDSPGVMEVDDRTFMSLDRVEDSEAGTVWEVGIFSFNPSIDSESIQPHKEKLLEIMPEISENWEEIAIEEK